MGRVSDVTAREPSATRVVLSGRCPACRRGRLFRGLLAFHKQCPHCGLSLDDRDIGDASVYPAILLVGCTLGVLGVWIEFAYHPSLWVHAALLGPLTLVLTLVTLRISRALFIYIDYKQELKEAERRQQSGDESYTHKRDS